MTRQFQYEKQSFQEECVDHIVQIFGALEQGQDFGEVMKNHHHQNKYPFPVHPDNKNIDIMMETGTGKTFTFLQTMLELCKFYDYKKFIILIPSVPIREGTKSNLEDTREYFKSLYANEREKEIQPYVYEDSNTGEVIRFINDNRLSVLILTPASFSSRTNILNRPLEKEIYTPELFQQETTPPKTYLECLKRLNPIVIMDEPHRFSGDAFKKYFTGFENYYLRFGATFPRPRRKSDNHIPLSNVAYTLDSITSFRQNLVKKIVVYTQDVLEDTDTLIGIRRVGSTNRAIVQTLKNGIVLQRELGVGDVFNGRSIRKILVSAIYLSDDIKIDLEYELSDEAIRSMIRQTIRIHFKKEKFLFDQGIKALTLFFIKSDTALFRGENPKIKNIFEEEYIRIRQKQLDHYQSLNDLPGVPEYIRYLQNDYDEEGRLQVHKGYFSGDRGNKDARIKAGVDEILKDKKKLLSFASPTRFIFSIWALQEGWDNPNVFTICKLTNQGSEISRLQQIGRGLRIGVDQNLRRKTLAALKGDQELFWQINNLDVLVSSKEQGFVEGIQNEILANSFFIREVFSEQELKRLLKEKNNFDDHTVRRLFKLLDDEKMILFRETIDGQDIFEKSSEFSQLLLIQDLPEDEREALKSLFAFDGKAYVKDGDRTPPKKKVFIKEEYLDRFRTMWDHLNKKSFYVIEDLDEEEEKSLINHITAEIEELDIRSIVLQTIRQELDVHRIEEEDAIYEKAIASINHRSEVRYLDFVRDLASRTRTPLSFIVKIFNSLSAPFRDTMLVNNPRQAMAEMTKIIQKHLVRSIRARIRYDGISGRMLPNILQSSNGKTYLAQGSVGKFQKDISDHEFSLKEKWIFEEVIEYDSEFEVEIIEKDPEIEQIEIFGKLPRLRIQTPLGEYNPDFCYTLRGKNGKQLILIVEAKGYDTATDIPPDERKKIEFAKLYFDKLNAYYAERNDQIRIRYTKRIKRQELASLISEL